MTDREQKILTLAKTQKKLKSADVAALFKVSRQYAAVLINGLIAEEKLVKVGSTNASYYILPEMAGEKDAFPPKIIKRIRNQKLQEHEIYISIQEQYPPLKLLNDNIKSILNYSFSEMVNNAIEHSKSKYIEVEVALQGNALSFTVNDFGIGVYRNVMREKNLKSEVEAMQDLLKGKTTTMPKSHSGQGIFFTSKAGDVFILESYGYALTINNKTHEVSYKALPALKRGTRVTFLIDVQSQRHLSAIFKKFSVGTDFAFNKTEIKVTLYTSGDGVHISRSQARRILHGLDKFDSIILDFDNVQMVGQAFADEIFRVFKERHPHIEIQPINMNEGVRFMVERVGK
jgi:anti-sigma regulatory factor (Ser/Thr protein kinase)